ncbi:hypothetical protein IFR05_013413 [Cadophora sp. M221]|nr:hypothetical protein IFR05_013413 [Cadophora sp. M221]
MASTHPAVHRSDNLQIDTNFFLPVLMKRHFLQNGKGSARSSDFPRTTASVFPENSDLTYSELAQISASKIVTLAAPFATPDQTIDNLIGGGRIPFDVNTALVPAALRSIALLANAGILEFNSALVNEYTQVWEDSALEFFKISIPVSNAQSLLENYATAFEVAGLQSQSESLDSDVSFYAIAFEGNNNLS